MLVFVDDCTLLGWKDSVVDFSLAGQVSVKVSQVFLNTWDVGWLDLFCLKLVHVQVGEPWVRQDFIDAVASKSRLAVLVKKFNDEVLSLGWDRDAMTDGIREAHRALSDEEVHSMLVSVEEGWDSDDHLENQDT